MSFCPDQLLKRYSAAPIRPRLEHEYLDLLCAEMAQSISLPLQQPCNDHHRVRQRFLYAVRAHLKFEDWAVYPALLRNVDPTVAREAARLQVEMGGLEQQLNKYSRKWMVTTVTENWCQYRRETNELLADLTRRMRQEERHLYSHLTQFRRSYELPEGITCDSITHLRKSQQN
jgi:hypothetical protein